MVKSAEKVKNLTYYLGKGGDTPPLPITYYLTSARSLI
jgi:hypothetical protein